MTDPATPKALRAIASMMRMDGYRTDAAGVEALVLDNAADEIDRLQAERDWQYDENVNRIAKEGAALLEVEQMREENKKLHKTVEYYAIESNWEYWLKNQSIANIRAWQTLQELNDD